MAVTRVLPGPVSVAFAPITVAGSRSRSKVAVMFAVRSTPVAPDAGVRAVTVGDAPWVVKVHVTSAASAVPSLARRPVVSRAAYVVDAASGLVGWRVMRRLIES